LLPVRIDIRVQTWNAELTDSRRDRTVIDASPETTEDYRDISGASAVPETCGNI
jgi:hypothetical protein